MFLRRFREAETSLERAVALNLNDPFIIRIHALLLNYTGKHEAALLELEQARQRDPFADGSRISSASSDERRTLTARHLRASPGCRSRHPGRLFMPPSAMPSWVNRNWRKPSLQKSGHPIPISKPRARRYSETGGFPRRSHHLGSLPCDPAAP